jgi:hypothetical protein
MAQVFDPSAATEEKDVPGITVTSPAVLLKFFPATPRAALPQQCSEPVTVNAQVCALPAETAEYCCPLLI